MVFVLSNDQQPLDPCHPARARQLLKTGSAATQRHSPFTIVLKGRTGAASTPHAHRLKVDPGSKTTGMALVQEEGGRVAWVGELNHRRHAIRAALLQRRAVRRARRQRHTRPHGMVPEPPAPAWLGGPQSGESGQEYRNVGHTAAESVSGHGASTPAHLRVGPVQPLPIRATGHGHRQMAGLNKYGMTVRHRTRTKRHVGFQTGDMVRARVPMGKRAGVHVGRVLVRASGSFDVQTVRGRQAGISYRYLTPLHRQAGYSYGWQPASQSAHC